VHEAAGQQHQGLVVVGQGDRRSPLAPNDVVVCGTARSASLSTSIVNATNACDRSAGRGAERASQLVFSCDQSARCQAEQRLGWTAMDSRLIPRLGREVSVIGLGTWQLGADWGDVDPAAAEATLDGARESGVTFFDTADVYGDGRSEQFCGAFHRNHPEVFVATKMGRRADQVLDSYSAENFADWNTRSRENLGMTPLPLVQLHCPPDAVFTDDGVYDALDTMVADGRIAAYGVSVETCSQALAAIARPHVSTVQIVLSCFRLKPLDEVLPAARSAGVGIIARVPLASGLLSGRYDETTSFAADDHRSYNRNGEMFDVGETFAGVPFRTGLAAVAELKELLDPGQSLPQFALRWIIDQPGVSTVIPGARNPAQARANAASAAAAPLRAEQLDGVRDVYDRLLRPVVHDRW
jgi:aryl-alcohol dehydrogenase-like predicted oxidoreductase